MYFCTLDYFLLYQKLKLVLNHFRQNICNLNFNHNCYLYKITLICKNKHFCRYSALKVLKNIKQCKIN